MKTSAPQARYERMAEPILQQFPEPQLLTGAARDAFYEILVPLTHQPMLRCYFVEGDALREIESDDHSRFHGPKIWQEDRTQNLSGNHYPYAYVQLNKALEERCPQIQPNKTVMLDVTSGSAGNGFGHIGKLRGFDRLLFVPHEIHDNDPARFVLMKEMVESGPGSGSGSVIETESSGTYLYEAIRTFQRKMVELGGKRAMKEGMFAIPNHAMVPTTVEACTQVSTDACRLLLEKGVTPDASLVGLGNGTSAQGEAAALRKVFGKGNVALHGYEGRANPGVYQSVHGPLKNREETITLYGIDGTGDLGLSFPAIDTLKEEGEMNMQNIHLISNQQWEEVYETLNRGRVVGETMGRSSAAGIALAQQLITRFGYQHILCKRFDTAAPYGEYVPIGEGACYLGYGRWTDDMLAEEYLQLLKDEGRIK